MTAWLDIGGQALGGWLSCPRPGHRSTPAYDEDVRGCLRPGDVLLVEGSSRISTVIQYLTQSSWSHAALFVGEVQGRRLGAHPGQWFIEADLVEGVRMTGFEAYRGHALRICRPVGLTTAEIERLIDYAHARLGHRYDLHNLLDLARYLLPLPPVPARWRRSLLGVCSGDPTRAICSTLIAEAFQSVRYPILPIPVSGRPGRFRRRHASLFTPRDFDLSPFFRIVKPQLRDFRHRALRWEEGPALDAAAGVTAPAR
ncbi:YiiX/YebB-like N1pC/P60 family cysteine hydrolase [Halomonas koreensis]|uniref:YiiX/YebB-like N1pC/P60 family cysteine hydrolase n=1 Tax=Halomonas koreensis TaxID=245385 RepID=A0ABU1FXZ3_9GAMM|nr:YiiX/YebB-like N1pC/P60 family cysteine hydrolase [Halomonas koreensis]MDR5865535.1 YiiX/YebB-like N1pC/P60 family cysteine hydrolase [Halomonas koreensis]